MITPVPDGHTVVLKNRESLEVSGVRQVESFDDKSVVLETTLGLLSIRGSGLHINQLNVEEEKLVMEGEIKILEYCPDRAQLRGKGLLARLLKLGREATVLELQLTVVGWTLLCGIGLGLVFDLWRVCRVILHSGAWLPRWAIFSLASGNCRGGGGVISGDLWGSARLVLAELSFGFILYQELISKHIQRPLRRGLLVLVRSLVRVAVWLGLPVWLPLKFVLKQGAAGVERENKLGGRSNG